MYSPIPCLRWVAVRGRGGLLALVIMSGLPAVARADYTGPVPAPVDAFGGPGAYPVVTETFPSPDWPGQVVTVYRPDGVSGPRPTWFFSHGFGGTNPAFYGELLTHLASHGAVVVFSPYPTELLHVADNYATMYDGFVAAARRYPDLIDTTRVAFAGHSYGGGAVPAIALRALREQKWGANGVALLLLAPWYSYFVSDADLAGFPSGTQAVVQIYEDDTMNDHRMAIDIFNHLGVPAEDKDFLLLHSDRIDGYNYSASHLVPTGAGAPRNGAAFNALDAWGVLRIAQALAASAWERDSAAHAVALGNGGPEQIRMGVAPSGRALRPMSESDAPVPLFPSSRYLQPWDGALNPRRGEALPAGVRQPHLSNLSVRGLTTSPSDPLMVGAVVRGDRPKSLLVRGVGPALGMFNVTDPVRGPAVITYRDGRQDIVDDDWADTPTPDAFTAAGQETGAFPLADGSKDAGFLASFAPGIVNVHALPVSAPGVVLVELYDADDDAGARLVNLSARARVSEGDSPMIAGFTTSGPGNMRLLVRAVGPGLASFGVPDAIADPQIEIYLGRQRIAENDDWSADQQKQAEIVAATDRVGAFTLTSGSADACVVVTVPPGSFTAVARSRDGSAGSVLLEVYAIEDTQGGK